MIYHITGDFLPLSYRQRVETSHSGLDSQLIVGLFPPSYLLRAFHKMDLFNFQFQHYMNLFLPSTYAHTCILNASAISEVCARIDELGSDRDKHAPGIFHAERDYRLNLPVAYHRVFLISSDTNVCIRDGTIFSIESLCVTYRSLLIVRPDLCRPDSNRLLLRDATIRQDMRGETLRRHSTMFK